jgi:hypothetical protein
VQGFSLELIAVKKRWGYQQGWPESGGTQNKLTAHGRSIASHVSNISTGEREGMSTIVGAVSGGTVHIAGGALGEL